MPFVKNQAATLHFSLVSSSDGETAHTTPAPTVYITQDGGTQATATNTAVHEGNGQWSLAMTASEMNADDIGVQVAASGVVTRDFVISTIPNHAPTAAAIVDEWETQSQADPTGFHVNVIEIGGTVQTPANLGSAATVDAVEVIPELTHFCEGVTSRSIIELNSGFSGTLALKPDIGDSVIALVNSATLSGAAAVTGTNLRRDVTTKFALYDVAAMSTLGLYTASVNITTTDNQTLVYTGTVRVN